jgi:predicted lipoprotein with Yx(FWY)xxD motif
MLLRMRARMIIAGLALSAVLLSGLVSGASAQPGAPVTVADAGSLGPILTDTNGLTLYIFAPDTQGTSTCNGPCATAWPPLVTEADPLSPPDFGGTLGGTTRLDGSRQVTYNGMPLYRFAGDAQPGDTNGQGLDSFGGLWFVVNPTA